MQFTGHSLPVRQSMSVPWEFFTSSHFISQFPPTRFSLITAIRMCHLLPVHHLEMAFLAGSKGQNTTKWYMQIRTWYTVSLRWSQSWVSLLLVTRRDLFSHGERQRKAARPAWTKSPQQDPGGVPLGWETEEMLSGILKQGMVKRGTYVSL